MTDLLQNVLAICVLAYTALTFYRGYKASQISDTLAVFKETDQGESITFQLNFTKGMAEDEKFDRVQKAFDLAETRHRFVDERFKAIIENAQKEKASQTNVVGLK